MRAEWKMKIRGIRSAINDDSISFEETREQVSSALRKSRWYKELESQSFELEDVVCGLEDAEDVDEFDFYLGEMYDLADYHRVWLD